MVLGKRYGSPDSSMEVGKRMELNVCYFDQKHLYQRLLSAMNQFFLGTVAHAHASGM